MADFSVSIRPVSLGSEPFPLSSPDSQSLVITLSILHQWFWAESRWKWNIGHVVSKASRWCCELDLNRAANAKCFSSPGQFSSCQRPCSPPTSLAKTTQQDRLSMQPSGLEERGCRTGSPIVPRQLHLVCVEVRQLSNLSDSCPDSPEMPLPSFSDEEQSQLLTEEKAAVRKKERGAGGGALVSYSVWLDSRSGGDLTLHQPGCLQQTHFFFVIPHVLPRSTFFICSIHFGCPRPPTPHHPQHLVTPINLRLSVSSPGTFFFSNALVIVHGPVLLCLSGASVFHSFGISSRISSFLLLFPPTFFFFGHFVFYI